MTNRVTEFFFYNYSGRSQIVTLSLIRSVLLIQALHTAENSYGLCT